MSSEDANEESYQSIHAKCRSSVQHTCKNEFQSSTDAVKAAFEIAEKRATEFPKEPNLEAFVLLVSASTSFLGGVISFQNNQMDELLEKMRKVESLADKGPDWPGKDLIKTFGSFFCGLALFAMAFKTKSVKQGGQATWKIVAALRQLRGGTLLREASDYPGRERDFVRGNAVYTNAQINLAISGLPPAVVSTATWLMKCTGDRAEALAELEGLWREDSMLSPAAASTLLGNYLDEMNVGRAPTAEQLKTVEELLSWAKGLFPDSTIFTQYAALREARRRDVAAACELQRRSLESIGGEYPGLRAFGFTLLGKYCATLFRWQDAAGHFRSSLALLKECKRRAGGPDAAVMAALCHAMARDDAAAAEMLSVVREYKKENKKDWSPMDVSAFMMAEKAPQEGPWVDGPSRAMDRLVFWWQSVCTMDAETAQRCLATLREQREACAEGAKQAKLQACSLLADAHRQLGEPADVLAVCDGALVRGAGKPDCSDGAIPLLCFSRAWALAEQSNIAGASEALQRYHECGKEFPQHSFLSFRVASLEQHIGVSREAACIELQVGRRDSQTVAFAVPGGDSLPAEVRWDVVLTDHDITFVASFQPSGGDAAELHREERWEASSGPLSGSFRPEGPGVLRLLFDNRASWVRSRTLMYQVTPALEAVGAS